MGTRQAHPQMGCGMRDGDLFSICCFWEVIEPIQRSCNNVEENSRDHSTKAKLTCWSACMLVSYKSTNKSLTWKQLFFSFFHFLFSFPHSSQSVSFLLDVPCLICFFSVFQTLLKHCVSIDVVKCSLLFFVFILQTSLIFFFPPPLEFIRRSHLCTEERY